MTNDFSSVTEVPGLLVSREAVDMLLTRYAFGAALCDGRRVLEIACGPGPGLAYLARRAAAIVGGDRTFALLERARREHGHAVPLVCLDAQALPFRRGAFDVALLFEAIYFMPDAARVFENVRDALAPGGVLVVVSANPELPDFNPAPFSTRYLTAAELRDRLGALGFTVEILGAFPVDRAGARGRLLSAVKRMAVRLHLIPRTMRGKELLKRLIFGKLVPFPAAVSDAMGTRNDPVALADPAATAGVKVIYAVARKEGTM